MRSNVILLSAVLIIFIPLILIFGIFFAKNDYSLNVLLIYYFIIIPGFLALVAITIEEPRVYSKKVIRGIDFSAIFFICFCFYLIINNSIVTEKRITIGLFSLMVGLSCIIRRYRSQNPIEIP